MMNAILHLSTVEIVVCSAIVLLAIWMIGSIAHAVLQEFGFGPVPNGVLVLGGLVSGAVVRSSFPLGF
jgi:hypothetical protein